jgi:inhibitor of KinA
LIDELMEIAPLGDSAVIVRFRGNAGDPPGKNLNAVLAAERRLKREQIPGVIEIASAYISVVLFYDPSRVVIAGAKVDRVIDWLAERIRHALSNTDRNFNHAEIREIDVPVCFDLGLDLEEVVSHTGIEKQEIIDLYCATEYRVSCIGFTPGFPFLSGLPGKLAMPRRAIPRKDVPAGSVAIGGAQTGIYPIRSPGGWNIIGRTSLRLFDPKNNPPALLRAGDRVRFRSIPRDEFEGSTT